MAHKKRARRVTSTGNTKKGDKAKPQKRGYVFDATKAAQTAVAKGVLHPDDPIVEFCQYLATGKRLDSKTLVKKLPKTTQLMMQTSSGDNKKKGKENGNNSNSNSSTPPKNILPQDFATTLSALVYDVQFAATQSQMTRDNVSDHIRSVVLHVAKGLGKIALGGNKQDKTTKIEPSLPEAQDFLHEYAQRCYHRSQVMDPASAGPWRHIQFYQLAMDEICEKYAPQLDRLLLLNSPNTANDTGSKLQTTTSLFLKTCPLYQKNLMVYSALVETLFDETLQGKMMDSQATLADQKRHLALAAIGVTKGLHDVRRTCWECGTVHTASIQSCTLCRVANYCGRACQVKAWRGGHQRKCKVLASAYDQFQESLKTIEAKHKTDDDFDTDQSDATHSNINNMSSTSLSASSAPDTCTGDSCGTNHTFDEDSDYAIFQAMVGGSRQLEVPQPQPQSPDDDTDEEDDDAVPILETEASTVTSRGGPSMAMFYKNLERLQNGDLWLFPSNNKNVTNELGAYAQALIQRGNMSTNSLKSTATMGGSGMEAVQEAEHAYFLQLARFLCFDVVSLAHDIAMLGDEKENKSNLQQVSCLGSIFQLAEIHFEGLVMPRERFLELYHKQSSTSSSSSKGKSPSAKEVKAARLDQARMRRMRKGYATRDFMDAHHK